MPIRFRSFILAVLGVLFVSVPVLAPGVVSAHTDPCHAAHTCPSDVGPPDYACGDNPSGSCSAPNSPSPGQSNAAPPLGGPPTTADCESFEIYYTGSICKQVLGAASATPGASALPSPSTTPVATAAATSFPPFTVPPAFTPDQSLGTIALTIWAIALAAAVFLVAAMWRLFTRAGEPGWAALIPIYNGIVYLKIADKPWWWILIAWSIVPVFIANRDIARSFGKSPAFGAGMTLLPFVFLPMLAFGRTDYRRPHRGPKPLPL